MGLNNRNHIQVCIKNIVQNILICIVICFSTYGQAGIIGDQFRDSHDVLMSNQNSDNFRPVIGIYTQDYKTKSPNTHTYIAASYVKFIRMSGAEVVPIHAFDSQSVILEQVKKVNGVLFPGGKMWIDRKNKWTRNALAIINYAIQENNIGNVFPLFGICLGFQLMAYLTSVEDRSLILEKIQGQINVVRPLNMLNQQYYGYLLQEIDEIQYEKVAQQGIMYYQHKWGITLQTFNKVKQISDFWDLIATSTTSQQVQIVAYIQAKQYSFYGVQFHPEKIPFEPKIQILDRSPESNEVVSKMSRQFTEKAKLNNNRFDSVQQFIQMEIQNSKLKVIQGKYFKQIYIFNKNRQKNDKIQTQQQRQDEELQHEQKEQEQQY